MFLFRVEPCLMSNHTLHDNVARDEHAHNACTTEHTYELNKKTLTSNFVIEVIIIIVPRKSVIFERTEALALFADFELQYKSRIVPHS